MILCNISVCSIISLYNAMTYTSPQAMAVVKQVSLSSAVFAPGWVYETQQKSHFFDNQDKYVSL